MLIFHTDLRPLTLRELPVFKYFETACISINYKCHFDAVLYGNVLVEILYLTLRTKAHHIIWSLCSSGSFCLVSATEVVCCYKYVAH